MASEKSSVVRRSLHKRVRYMVSACELKDRKARSFPQPVIAFISTSTLHWRDATRRNTTRAKFVLYKRTDASHLIIEAFRGTRFRDSRIRGVYTTLGLGETRSSWVAFLRRRSGSSRIAMKERKTGRTTARNNCDGVSKQL